MACDAIVQQGAAQRPLTLQGFQGELQKVATPPGKPVKFWLAQ